MRESAARNRASLVTFLLLMGSTFACMARSAPNPEQNMLAGTWNVADSGRGTVQFGIRIDQTNEESLNGVVLRIFSGNTGIDVSSYSQLRGEVNGEHVTLRATNERDGSLLEFQFERVERGLRVIAISWAGESLVGDPNTWMAWRD